MDNTNEEEKMDGMEGGENNNNENKDMPSEGSNDTAPSTEEGE